MPESLKGYLERRQSRRARVSMVIKKGGGHSGQAKKIGQKNKKTLDRGIENR
jgi:hypothetical protein